MCVCCDNWLNKNWECRRGEKCARMAGYVKEYNTVKGMNATFALELKAEWEHVIPKAVLKQIDWSLYPSQNLESMYKRGLVYAVAWEIHRGAVDGFGGGITSTGNSKAAQGWADCIAKLFNTKQANRAVELLIADEVHSINIFRSDVCREMDTLPYIAALGAVLHEYATRKIITWDCVGRNYAWLCFALTGSPF